MDLNYEARSQKKMQFLPSLIGNECCRNYKLEYKFIAIQLKVICCFHLFWVHFFIVACFGCSNHLCCSSRGVQWSWLNLALWAPHRILVPSQLLLYVISFSIISRPVPDFSNSAFGSFFPEVSASVYAAILHALLKFLAAATTLCSASSLKPYLSINFRFCLNVAVSPLVLISMGQLKNTNQQKHERKFANNILYTCKS